MYKAAVIGDRQSVMGFRALGLTVECAETPEQAAGALHRPAGRATGDEEHPALPTDAPGHPGLA